VGSVRSALLLLAVFVLSGCLPTTAGDEEKEAHFLAGKSHVRNMDFKGAIESFEKAVEANPKSAPAHFELGWLYDQKAVDPAAAIYHYERFLKLLPNSSKEEMVKAHVLACKQQLAQTVSLGPVTERQQREFELLAEENKRLREDIEKWRAYALRLQNQTNQPNPALPAARPTQSLVPAQSVPTESISASRPTFTPAASSRTHTVKANETLRMIARQYSVKVEALMAANPRVDPRRLRIGQALIIPPP
jgi:tetratricopeptide (TPR) repeat protein